MFKGSERVAIFVTKDRENWREELIAKGQCKAEVKIQKGFSQGDQLSPLCFFIKMRKLTYI